MPQLIFPFTPEDLRLQVLIGLNQADTLDLVTRNLPVPRPIRASAIIDTGSNITGVAKRIVAKLQLEPGKSSHTQTAGGKRKVELFFASLSITSPDGATSPMLVIPQLTVMHLPRPIPDVEVIVGLDVLLNCRLLIDGPARQFTLSF